MSFSCRRLLISRWIFWLYQCAHSTHHNNPSLDQYWSSVCDADPTLTQQWVNAQCLPTRHTAYPERRDKLLSVMRWQLTWHLSLVLARCWASVVDYGQTTGIHSAKFLRQRGVLEGVQYPGAIIKNAVAAGSTMDLYQRPVTKEGYYFLPENNIEVFPLAIKVTFIL